MFVGAVVAWILVVLLVAHDLGAAVKQVLVYLPGQIVSVDKRHCAGDSLCENRRVSVRSISAPTEARDDIARMRMA